MTQDAVEAGPNNYKVILDNDRVRVLEYRGSNGDKTPMHSHPAQVAIGITDMKAIFTFPDGQTQPIELKAGEAMYIAEPMSHAVEVTGEGEAHALLIELK